MKNIFVAFLFLISIASNAQKIIAGPMLGHTDFRTAKVWVHFKADLKDAVLSFTEKNNKTNPPIIVNFSTLPGGDFNIATATLTGLEPGKTYNYSITQKNSKEVLATGSVTTQTLWQWRTDPPAFSFITGSCAYINEPRFDRPGKPYGSNYSIFESIAKKNPDIMIWGGDNIYLREADWDSKTGIYHRYTYSRKIKETQALLAKTQNFAIWDDHDFGPNDGDRGFYYKYETQQAFKDFWANKSYGMNPNQKEGIYSCFNWGDAEVFLLDNRFFRSPNDRLTGEKVLLGASQIQWLIDALVTSKASFKIIVIGGQVLSSAAVYENYENYKTEKEALLNEITANKIKGVTFISGDRHFTELSMLKRSDAYSLYDWTVSPLTSGHGNIEKIAKTFEDDAEEETHS